MLTKGVNSRFLFMRMRAYALPSLGEWEFSQVWEFTHSLRIFSKLLFIRYRASAQKTRVNSICSVLFIPPIVTCQNTDVLPSNVLVVYLHLLLRCLILIQTNIKALNYLILNALLHLVYHNTLHLVLSTLMYIHLFAFIIKSQDFRLKHSSEVLQLSLLQTPQNAPSTFDRTRAFWRPARHVHMNAWQVGTFITASVKRHYAFDKIEDLCCK